MTTKMMEKDALLPAQETQVSKEAEDAYKASSEQALRRYTSDSELHLQSQAAAQGESVASSESVGGSGEWLYVEHNPNNGAEAKEMNLKRALAGPLNFNKYSIVLRPGLKRHDPRAFIKCCETLAFLVRDAAHITPDNFESCVQCLRTFVEASLDGGRYAAFPRVKDNPDQESLSPTRSKKIGLKKKAAQTAPSRTPSVHHPVDPSSQEGEEMNLTDSYHQISHQLIDLSHTLHTKAATIFKSWADADPKTGVDASPAGLWHQCWRPLLQCIARLCCDCRRQIRASALSYLQRAFVIPDMQTLTPDLWEDCFAKVLFPLLAKLLENISPMDPLGMEETRVRAMTLLCKVFLQHLNPLSSLPTFNALWMTILDFTERYMHTDRSYLLSDSIPESLKNMLRVMDTAGMFNSIPGLYLLTKDRLSTFLPTLMEEVLPNAPAIQDSHQQTAAAHAPADGASSPAPHCPSPPVHVDEPLNSVVVVPRHNDNPPSPPAPPSSAGGLLTSQLPIDQRRIILHPPSNLMQQAAASPPAQTYQTNPLFDAVPESPVHFPGVPPEPQHQGAPTTAQYFPVTHHPGTAGYLPDPQTMTFNEESAPDPPSHQ